MLLCLQDLALQMQNLVCNHLAIVHTVCKSLALCTQQILHSLCKNLLVLYARTVLCRNLALKFLKESCSAGAKMVQEYYARNWQDIQECGQILCKINSKKAPSSCNKKIFCKFLQEILIPVLILSPSGFLFSVLFVCFLFSVIQ